MYFFGTEHSFNVVSHRHVAGILKINLFFSGYVKNDEILNDSIIHKNLLALSKYALFVDSWNILILLNWAATITGVQL